MKRFRWRLQKLLDVTAQREQAARVELAALTQEILQRRREIEQRMQAIQAMLERIAHESIENRILRQECFMEYSSVAKKHIAMQENEIQEFEQKRNDKIEEVMRIRASRETLEKMREEAHREHMREQSVAEQKLLDENAQIAFARKGRQEERESVIQVS